MWLERQREKNVEGNNNFTTTFAKCSCGKSCEAKKNEGCADNKWYGNNKWHTEIAHKTDGMEQFC